MTSPAHLPDYESTDATPRLIVGLGVGLFVLIGLGAVVGRALLPHPAYPEKTGGLPLAGPAPTDAADLARAWAAQDRQVEAHLHRYAWVDRGAGIAQIPIDRAMVLTANPPKPTPP